MVLGATAQYSRKRAKVNNISLGVAPFAQAAGIRGQGRVPVPANLIASQPFMAGQARGPAPTGRRPTEKGHAHFISPAGACSAQAGLDRRRAARYPLTASPSEALTTLQDQSNGAD